MSSNPTMNGVSALRARHRMMPTTTAVAITSATRGVGSAKRLGGGRAATSAARAGRSGMAAHDTRPRFAHGVASTCQAAAPALRPPDKQKGRWLAPPAFADLEVRVELLDLDLRALLLESGLDLVRLVAGNALLDRLRRRVNEVLGLLEAQAGQLAHDLDHGNLVRADLGQDGGEIGLLIARGRSLGAGTAGSGSGGHRDGGRRGHAEAVLELLLEIGELENAHRLERLEELIAGHRGHGNGNSFVRS